MDALGEGEGAGDRDDARLWSLRWPSRDRTRIVEGASVPHCPAMLTRDPTLFRWCRSRTPRPTAAAKALSNAGNVIKTASRDVPNQFVGLVVCQGESPPIDAEERDRGGQS
jgi:hypothetical protein